MVVQPPTDNVFPDLRFPENTPSEKKKEKKRNPDSGAVTMLTTQIIYPFRGDVNPRVGLSCSVDGNGKVSETLKTDARINKGKTG